MNGSIAAINPQLFGIDPSVFPEVVTNELSQITVLEQIRVFETGRTRSDLRDCRRNRTWFLASSRAALAVSSSRECSQPPRRNTSLARFASAVSAFEHFCQRAVDFLDRVQCSIVEAPQHPCRLLLLPMLFNLAFTLFGNRREVFFGFSKFCEILVSLLT
jgi:hypothetical protein